MNIILPRLRLLEYQKVFLLINLFFNKSLCQNNKNYLDDIIRPENLRGLIKALGEDKLGSTIKEKDLGTDINDEVIIIIIYN